jgi:hypothetical protein
MATEYAPRHCGIFMGNKSQALELRVVTGEGYEENNEDDALQLAADLAEAGEQVSQWAIWDNRKNAPEKRQDKPYPASTFKAMLKGQELALVWCKRGAFRAPVLKIGEINSKASNTGKRAAPVRFGRGA